ncbi:hypothetical protein ACEV6Q_15125 [Enterobacter ludwigii]|uniref:hypothetical protein n=1 Tax=Enterobacter ludwigii TaxID=299767 RepID=UPI003BEED7FF
MNTLTPDTFLATVWEHYSLLALEFDQLQFGHPEIWNNNFVCQAFSLYREKLKELPEKFCEEYLGKIEELSDILNNMIVLAEYHINSEVAA